MSNPTSSFGWQMPTASDLVTDLPADFETFGQAVDTTLADLKGGTTGQVLSKASNTDMDFTWVAQDDSNAIQNAIVDAKGDLIAASAADTPARLAVGTNGQVLTADSTAATGLAYTNKGWTLISTTSLSGASVTLSSIPQTYQSLKLVVFGMTNATADGYFLMSPNNTATTYIAMQENATNSTWAGAAWQTSNVLMRTNGDNSFVFTFDNYYLTVIPEKTIASQHFYVNPSATNIAGMTGGMSYHVGTGITSIKLSNSGGNFNTGTAYLYGVA